MSKRRTLADIIEELDAEASPRAILAASLAVGFENNTIFVFAHEDGRLQKLAELVTRGGEPLGIFTFSHSGTVQVRPLPEYAGEAWVQNYLHDLVASFCNTIEAVGAGRVAPGEN